VASSIDVPLCLDSSNISALASGLKSTPGKPLVNSVSGEEKRMRELLPPVRDHGAAVIGLVIDD